VGDWEFDDSIRDRIRRGSNSGYLAEEYEVVREFPTLHDYHFRIEDESDILELERLQQHSRPFHMQESFGNSSDAFKNRLEFLITQLDHHQASFPNHTPPEPHGFYQLADHYDDNAALESVLQKANA
jgi:hypothetical protein